MGVSDDVKSQVEKILNTDWNVREGRVVPRTSEVALSNGAVKIEAVFLYADLAGSTTLQKEYVPEFAAKAIRMYLGGTSQIIRHFNGEIRSFDGSQVVYLSLRKFDWEALL